MPGSADLKSLHFRSIVRGLYAQIATVAGFPETEAHEGDRFVRLPMRHLDTPSYTVIAAAIADPVQKQQLLDFHLDPAFLTEAPASPFEGQGSPDSVLETYDAAAFMRAFQATIERRGAGAGGLNGLAGAPFHGLVRAHVSALKTNLETLSDERHRVRARTGLWVRTLNALSCVGLTAALAALPWVSGIALVSARLAAQSRLVPVLWLVLAGAIWLILMLLSEHRAADAANVFAHLGRGFRSAGRANARLAGDALRSRGPEWSHLQRDSLVESERAPDLGRPETAEIWDRVSRFCGVMAQDERAYCVIANHDVTALTAAVPAGRMYRRDYIALGRLGGISKRPLRLVRLAVFGAVVLGAQALLAINLGSAVAALVVTGLTLIQLVRCGLQLARLDREAEAVVSPDFVAEMCRALSPDPGPPPAATDDDEHAQAGRVVGRRLERERRRR